MAYPVEFSIVVVLFLLIFVVSRYFSVKEVTAYKNVLFKSAIVKIILTSVLLWFPVSVYLYMPFRKKILKALTMDKPFLHNKLEKSYHSKV